MTTNKVGLRGFAFALVFFSACRPPIHTVGRPAVVKETVSADAVGVGEIFTPSGAKIAVTCTPSGPELCFDATDNNCNGIIDEGCGVQTGPLQFAIAWDEGPDVDLLVTDPKGDVVKPGDVSAAGLTKDRDCGRPQGSCRGQNMENVFFTGERPPPGNYKVEIKLDNPEDVHGPVKVRFGGRIGIKTFSLDVTLAAAGDAKSAGAAKADDSTKWWVTIPIQ